MKHAAFTLIELQVSLLLTIASLGSLFLLTFYFWQNHHERGRILQFQKNANLFFDWHHQTMRCTAQIQPSPNQTRFTAFDGSDTILKLTEDGPQFERVNFFEAPVKIQARYEEIGHGWDVVISVENPSLQLTRSWKCHYPKLELRNLRGLL